MQLTIGECLRLAETHLSAGNLVLTDFICREVLAADPRNAAALALLGALAQRLGLQRQAVDYFRAALARDPHYAPAKTSLASLAGAATPFAAAHAIDGRRYLLIKAWGFGFWSDTTHVLGSLLLADLTDRVPVVHWGRNSLFGDGSGRDAFCTYFAPVSPFTLETLAALPGADFFPAKWSPANLGSDEIAKWNGPGSRLGGIAFLARPETIAVADFYIGVIDLLPWIPRSHRLFGKSLDAVYRDLASRYLHPRPEILAAVDAFWHAHLAGTEAIAVHVRGTDKVKEMGDLARFNQLYFEYLDRCDPAWRIFLLTDDTRWVDAFRSRYGDRVVLTDCDRTERNEGLHYLPHTDRTHLGREVIVDVQLALRCARFVGNGASTVSAIIAALKSWRKGECVLLAPSGLQTRNLFLYAMTVS
jgi:hypothetical protein